MSDVDHDSLKSEELALESDTSSIEEDLQLERPAARLGHVAMEVEGLSPAPEGTNPEPEILEAISPAPEGTIQDTDIFEAVSPSPEVSPDVSEELVMPQTAAANDKMKSESGIEEDRSHDQEDDTDQSGGLTDRSTPRDMLQTMALGDTLAGLKPIPDYDSSESVTEEFAAAFGSVDQKGGDAVDKDARIKQVPFCLICCLYLYLYKYVLGSQYWHINNRVGRM